MTRPGSGRRRPGPSPWRRHRPNRARASSARRCRHLARTTSGRRPRAARRRPTPTGRPTTPIDRHHPTTSSRGRQEACRRRTRTGRPTRPVDRGRRMPRTARPSGHRTWLLPALARRVRASLSVLIGSAVRLPERPACPIVPTARLLRAAPARGRACTLVAPVPAIPAAVPVRAVPAAVRPTTPVVPGQVSAAVSVVPAVRPAEGARSASEVLVAPAVSVVPALGLGLALSVVAMVRLGPLAASVGRATRRIRPGGSRRRWRS